MSNYFEEDESDFIYHDELETTVDTLPPPPPPPPNDESFRQSFNNNPHNRSNNTRQTNDQLIDIPAGKKSAPETKSPSGNGPFPFLRKGR